ncbi:histidine phosphatase family protein [Labilibaculum sp.]|uniref:histidine phosphatase family protein n=1 Tax=Labilibaculum sp. TaxID=2060723 RepID=UPI003568BAE7
MIVNHTTIKTILIGIVVFSLWGCSAQSHLSSEKDLKGWSLNMECGTFTCITEVDSALQADLAQRGKKMLQIYLIRHAKPNVKKNFLYSADEAQQYVFNYNSATIVPFDSKLVTVRLQKQHNIYCSSLPRSQETALEIFGDQFPIVCDSIFREFEIRMVDATSFLKLPLPFWQAFSRGSWLLGFNHRGIESHKEAKQRAMQAAENLRKVAEEEGTAILVAHGMLNGAIKSELEKQDWKPIQKQGHLHLGATILVKIVDL